jgi:hypothetical protein
MSKIAINARTRIYKGPKSIKYAHTLGGEGAWKEYKDYSFSENEEIVVLDDMIYIFHNDTIEKFKNIGEETWVCQNETYHTNYWNIIGVKLNVIGINVYLTKYNTFSGHLN